MIISILSSLLIPHIRLIDELSNLKSYSYYKCEILDGFESDFSPPFFFFRFSNSMIGKGKKWPRKMAVLKKTITKLPTQQQSFFIFGS